MLLNHFRSCYYKGQFRFEQFGEIDPISDFPEGFCAHVDYDSNKDTRTLLQLWSRARTVGVDNSAICYSKTRRGWHVSIVLAEKLERAELIAYQLVCGDDTSRGALNLMRVISIRKSGGVDKFWSQRHNILYRRKIR